MLEAQKYYLAELGKTFKLNDPIVETEVGDHVKSWYETTAMGGDEYWRAVTNMQQERRWQARLRDPLPTRRCRHRRSVGRRRIGHRNGGSSNARNFRECKRCPACFNWSTVAIPMRMCSEIARS